jgi:outer membrane lipoprotein-sorting protein
MIFRSLFLLILGLLFLPVSTFASEATCSIENTASSELAKYVKTVDTLTATMKSAAASCGTRSNGVISSSRRVLDVLDKAWITIPIFGDLGLDFQYNIKIAFDGESRSAVIRNGQEFRKVENLLQSTLSVLAQKCNLNEQNKTTITQLLRDNHALESFYKNTALGYPANVSTALQQAYPALVREIQENYTPKATAWCKNQELYEDMGAEIFERIGNISTGIEDGLKEWEYAIALIRGWNAVDQKKYTELKSRLLTEELRRQGFSQGFIDKLVRNLNCVEGKTQWKDNDPVAWGQARLTCFTYESLGDLLSPLMKQWNSMVIGWNGAKTSDDYIKRLTTYRAIRENHLDTIDLYTTMIGTIQENTSVDTTMLTNLISLHVTLLSINTRIEERTKVMLGHCRKFQTSIPCDF